MPNVEPAELFARHQEHVHGFCQPRGLTPDQARNWNLPFCGAGPPAETWAWRSAISPTERRRFQLAVERRRDEVYTERAIDLSEQPDHWKDSAIIARRYNVLSLSTGLSFVPEEALADSLGSFPLPIRLAEKIISGSWDTTPGQRRAGNQTRRAYRRKDKLQNAA